MQEIEQVILFLSLPLGSTRHLFPLQKEICLQYSQERDSTTFLFTDDKTIRMTGRMYPVPFHPSNQKISPGKYLETNWDTYIKENLANLKCHISWGVQQGSLSQLTLSEKDQPSLVSLGLRNATTFGHKIYLVRRSIVNTMCCEIWLCLWDIYLCWT